MKVDTGDVDDVSEHIDRDNHVLIGSLRDAGIFQGTIEVGRVFFARV